VIENLTVEFHSGFNILSGETGSGKSILVDALSLALGGRASPDVIRSGRDRATVTAVFRAERKPPWKGWLEEYGLAGGDEGEIILRREIQTGGRSRLLVNDQPITLAAVKSLAALLVEVHGQTEHGALLGRDVQLDLLDQFADDEEWLEKVAALYARRRELEREMESLSQNEQDRLRTIDLLSFQARELEAARVERGEDVRLEDEKRVLANLEKIRAAASLAFGNLYEDEGAASARLAAVARALEDLRRYDPAVEPHLEPLAESRARLEDLAYFLRDYLGKLQANPQRLEEIEDRLAHLDRLKRKYGGALEEVLAYQERIGHELTNLEHADERRGEVARELEKAAASYRQAAEALSAQRRKAAGRLEKLVRAEVAQLGMEKARFQVHFGDPASRVADSSAPATSGTSRGIDDVEFLISPNPGEDLRSLEKIASGGELSRLMLALKTVVGTGRGDGGRSGASRTFVFDEVDAGIGGRVAESVGRRLKHLARDAQVLCVTHLAQIACFADHHYFVEKAERAGRTMTTISKLEGDRDRAAELARMLSGKQVTDAALQHAAALLKQASGPPA
ncbi:MAG: DNA repair protein RecN, partial [Acidobacteriia bacterium]|nr:DNA repair protein RecN [Terriglobia bacterium]